MAKDITVNWQPNASTITAAIEFAVIVSRWRNQWLLVRHHLRASWEFPGGKVEQGESPAQCAKRELFEETGACSKTMESLGYLIVEVNESVQLGQCFKAQIDHFDDMPTYEIAENGFFSEIPEKMTYPEITACILENL